MFFFLSFGSPNKMDVCLKRLSLEALQILNIEYSYLISMIKFHGSFNFFYESVLFYLI